MALIHFEIKHFRNLPSATLQPVTNGFNFIYGHNGSGKSSLLEAIYYLSLGKSFRSSVNERVIQHQHDKLSLFARVESDETAPLTQALGLERQATGALRLRLEGAEVPSISEFAKLVPVQLIDAQCHSLLDGGLQARRKYLDWGIFYAFPTFLGLWRRFARALKQRNAALRQHAAAAELKVWSTELALTVQPLHELRVAYIEQLLPVLQAITERLLPEFKVSLNYQPGWDIVQEYTTFLQQNLAKDQLLGFTQSGPHKADLKIKINNIPAKDILSRGQQKLFVCAMILARGKVLKNATNKRPIYLIDDLPAELDSQSRAKLIDLLAEQESQVFVTAIEKQHWDDFTAASARKMFHVEHGAAVEEPI